MKVILIEDVERLGQAGDVVKVKEGYGRNYLIPSKKAKPATAANLKLAESLKKKREALAAKEKEGFAALAERIASASCTIAMAAVEEDRLYGSVTADIIAAELEAGGIALDKKDILLEEPIKRLGVYQVPVRLKYDIQASLKVWVVQKEQGS